MRLTLADEVLDAASALFCNRGVLRSVLIFESTFAFLLSYCYVQANSELHNPQPPPTLHTRHRSDR